MGLFSKIKLFLAFQICQIIIVGSISYILASKEFFFPCIHQFCIICGNVRAVVGTEHVALKYCQSLQANSPEKNRWSIVSIFGDITQQQHLEGWLIPFFLSKLSTGTELCNIFQMNTDIFRGLLGCHSLLKTKVL